MLKSFVFYAAVVMILATAMFAARQRRREHAMERTTRQANARRRLTSEDTQ